MTWFIFALICILGWGFADLFYKKGTDESDRDSHLKIAVWVGIVMGVSSFALMPFAESEITFSSLIKNGAGYLPASLCYIISMVIGYAGLRYLELSIVSPVQNASGALSAICIAVYFAIKGSFGKIGDELGALDIAGTGLIVLGVIGISVIEQHIASGDISQDPGDRKYRKGALALIFPVLYCIFDTLGTSADGIILDEEAGLGLGEIDVLIIYGLTFFLFGIFAWLFMLVKSRRPFNPFARSERPKCIAAVCEEFGQIFYVYAMARNPVLAAPLVASYCIISVVLSAVFLKERLSKPHYIAVATVISGIVLLGISEGLAG